MVPVAAIQEAIRALFFFIIIVSRGNADGGLADLALGILPDLAAVAINAGRDEEAQIPSEREGEIAMTA